MSRIARPLQEDLLQEHPLPFPYVSLSLPPREPDDVRTTPQFQGDVRKV